MIATAALQEDVDVVGLSILSGAHMTLLPRITKLLREEGLDDVLVTAGGIIPDDDVAGPVRGRRVAGLRARARRSPRSPSTSGRTPGRATSVAGPTTRRIRRRERTSSSRPPGRGSPVARPAPDRRREPDRRSPSPPCASSTRWPARPTSSGSPGRPGAGKSTLVAALIGEVRKAGRAVAVVAVDPSSPITGGALLGDRVRMQCYAGDRDVFIRSMAARGHAGGLASTTGAATAVLDAAGFDLILVETVGTGQSEVEVAAAADTTVVLEAPEMGDEVQAIKAGLLEVADLVVVNKGDKPGRAADRRPAPGDARRERRAGRRPGGRAPRRPTAPEAAGGPDHDRGDRRRASRSSSPPSIGTARPRRPGRPMPRASPGPTRSSGRSSPSACASGSEHPSWRPRRARRCARVAAHGRIPTPRPTSSSVGSPSPLADPRRPAERGR